MNEKDKITLSAELLKQNQTLLEGDSGSYLIRKPLGLAGATARVYLVIRQQDDRPFALKLMQPGLSPEMRKRFQDEMVNLQRLSRREDNLGTCHIPRIIESSDLQQPATQELHRLLGSPFIIMDFADGTDVNTLLMDKNVLSEAEALEIFKQFAEVLYVIHSENLTYTDMKLGNLIWNSKTKHLMVIDWNVIAEDRLQEDAPRDRIRAAAYLYQVVTGVPIGFDRTGLAVADQKFRRLENFKSLSEGTRAFLLKAFHPDLSSRHGLGGNPLICTREFLRELQLHAERFKLSSPELILRGKDAIKERQWQEALEYLDAASRQIDIESDPTQFANLQEHLERARDEANKLGRNAFHSGYGRYMNGLYAEAREDFEKAMRDDPYDEEARFFAIATGFALQVGDQDFQQQKQPLEECIRALLRGHLDMAGNALNRIPALMHNMEAIRSLKAEIKVRNAVKDGQRLLREDKINEAQEFFSRAYQERDRILYVEPLEENLGSLTELYHKVEELKQLYDEGDAYLKEDRFHEAAWSFWKARGISQGSKLASQKYQCASSLDTIKKLLETGNYEQALEKCSQASGRFGDEPKLLNLKAQAIEARCVQLRTLADQALQSRKFDAAKEYILEILKWKPDDGPAKVKLMDIKKEIASGYQERIQEQESKLRIKPSIAACERAIGFIEEQGYQEFEEGQQFIKRAEALKTDIALMSNELDDLIAAGDLDAQQEKLNQAGARGWILRQGDPEQLKEQLKPRILEQNINRLGEYLRYCRIQEATDLCQRLLQSQLLAGKTAEVRELKKKTIRLADALEELNRIKVKKEKPCPGDQDTQLERLKLDRDYLHALQQMKHIEPELEIPEEIRQLEEKQTGFLKEVEQVMETLRQQGYDFLADQDFSNSREISFRMKEVLSITKEFDGNIGAGLETWQNWNREFTGLLALLEKGTAAWVSKFAAMMEKLKTLVREPRIKQVISNLNPVAWEEFQPDPGILQELAATTMDSPVAFWLNRFLEQELKIKGIWQAMNEDTARAEKLMHQYVGSGDLAYFEKALNIVGEVEGFLENIARLLEGKESSPELENQAEMLQQADSLIQELNSIPELKGKPVERRLHEQVGTLRRSMALSRKAALENHSQRLNHLLEKLPGTTEDHELRLRLEDEAREEIEKLRVFDREKAGQFENRLCHLLDQLLNISKLNLENQEERKRLNELQRRICEEPPIDNKLDMETIIKKYRQDDHFKDVISRYKQQYSNAQYVLKKRDKDFSPTGLKKLLDIREEYGQFPELDAAIRETRQEIFRKENHERFENLTREFKIATTHEDWQKLKARLETIEPSLLPEPDQARYLEMATVIGNNLVLREIPESADFEKYLGDGDSQWVAKWVQALEWNMKERNRIEIPPVTKHRLEEGERNWLNRENVEMEALLRQRWIKFLMQELSEKKNPAKPDQKKRR